MKIPSWSWFLIVLALSSGVGIPAAANAAPQDSPPVVSEVPLPGGIAAWLRAADVPGSPDPAAGMLGFVRATYANRAVPPDNVRSYLDAIWPLQEAAAVLPNHEVDISQSGPPSYALLEWADACGLTIAGGRVTAASDPEAASRRHALEQSGMPVAEWIERLNAGKSVRIEIPIDAVPLPLPPDVWNSAVLHRDVPRGRLACAIFGDRHAALLYHGLMALDDETLAYMAGHAALLSAIAAHSAGVFAEWGRSIHIRNGRVRLPGGQEAAALWANVVGQAPADTELFIRALLSRDGGRAAFLYDTVMHLDPARQAFALGAALPDDRAGRFSALYASFARTATIDSTSDWPVVRHPAGPAAILAQVRVSDAGRMTAPSSRAFWDAVFGGNIQGCSTVASTSGEVDAAWLTTRIERESLEKRVEWLAAVTFAQRVFGRANALPMKAACEVVAAFPRYQALLLALERMGLDEPGDYLNGLRFAARLWAGIDRRAAVMRTAQAQGVLVILERAVSARVIDTAAARRLVMSLAALGTDAAEPSAESGLMPGALGTWMRDTLLPELCKGQVAADACLVRAVSGKGAAPGSVVRDLTWEDERYRIDLGAATATRIERVRTVQKATRIQDGLELLFVAARLSDSHAGAEEAQRDASIVKALLPTLTFDLPELFGHGIPNLRATLQSASARLAATPGAAEKAEVASVLVDAADLLLADALVSFAYALSIGEPDAAALMGGDPSRQHRLDATIGPATQPWHLPEEVQAPDRSWLIEGSALGLRTVFATSWLRRLSIEDPDMAPRPDLQDVRGFGETEADFNAFDLTDASRDIIVAAIRRGRARFAELLSRPDDLWAAAAQVGISEWRCRAAQWVAARGEAKAEPAGRASGSGPADYVSLSEFMWLGNPDTSQAVLDAWGTSVRVIDGSLTLRMPRGHAWEDLQGPRGVGLLAAWVADVHLRVAEILAEHELPASLAPEIASYAVWDVISAARMAHPDDWLALVRATRTLPEDRTFDYISALTVIGPLVPTK